MFGKVNIAEELVKERGRHSLLDEAHSIFRSEDLRDAEIAGRIAALNPSSGPLPSIGSGELFSEEDIRSVCINYRLRFLEAALFKGEIPYDAILKIKHLERECKVKLSEFRVMAPASLFKLEDRNKDPLLFAKVSGGKYLLIHKWGNDLSALRKFLAFPLRSIRTFILTLVVLSLLVTLSIPAGYAVRVFVFLLSNLFFLSMFAHIGYMRLNQNFSEFEWESKFVN